MNRSESKYFNTAAKMNEAFLTLLEKKDFAYITVKEICECAGVNRSTFYLHYETLDDLLTESVQNINAHFLDYMQRDAGGFIAKLRTCPVSELYLVTPEYLKPYLGYIQEHKRLFRTVLENAAALRLDESYRGMFRHVLTPILERFGIPEAEHRYLMTFYINGLMAIITAWLEEDCADAIDHVIAVIQRCIPKT